MWAAFSTFDRAFISLKQLLHLSFEDIDMKKILLLFVSLILFYSCNNEVDVITPLVDPSNFLDQTDSLQINMKSIMEGVYEVTKGNELLGDQVVVKWNRDQVMNFCRNKWWIFSS